MAYGRITWNSVHPLIFYALLVNVLRTFLQDLAVLILEW